MSWRRLPFLRWLRDSVYCAHAYVAVANGLDASVAFEPGITLEDFKRRLERAQKAKWN